MDYATIGLRQGGDARAVATRLSRSSREAERWNETPPVTSNTIPRPIGPPSMSRVEQIAVDVRDKDSNWAVEAVEDGRVVGNVAWPVPVAPSVLISNNVPHKSPG